MRKALGYLFKVLAAAGVLLLIFLLIVLIQYRHHDTSGAPLTLAAVALLTILMWKLGQRLGDGRPLWVPSLRWPAGILLFVAAAIFWILGPLWPAIVLGVGGLVVILSWRVPARQ